MNFLAQYSTAVAFVEFLPRIQTIPKVLAGDTAHGQQILKHKSFPVLLTLMLIEQLSHKRIFLN